MAKQTLNTIKNWFKTGLKPTQAQFWDTWDSFWQKDEKIPTASVEGLDTILMGKASQEGVNSSLNSMGEDITTWLSNKVDKVDGASLLPDTEVSKITAAYAFAITAIRKIAFNDVTYNVCRDYFKLQTRIDTIDMRGITAVEYSTDAVTYVPATTPVTILAGSDIYWRVTFANLATSGFLNITGTLI